MKEVLAVSAVAFICCLADANAEIRPIGVYTLQPPKTDVAYYYSRRHGHRIHTFPSGQRYTGRGPYIRYVTPGGHRTGPIPRSAWGGG